MYKARRRVRCGKAFSGYAVADVGVLAGCPIAMGALLLSILDPIEQFWKSGPKGLGSLKVYVNDFALSFNFETATHA